MRSPAVEVFVRELLVLVDEVVQFLVVLGRATKETFQLHRVIVFSEEDLVWVPSDLVVAGLMLVFALISCFLRDCLRQSRFGRRPV